MYSLSDRHSLLDCGVENTIHDDKRSVSKQYAFMHFILVVCGALAQKPVGGKHRRLVAP